MTTLMLHSSGTGPRQFKAFESRIQGRLICPDLRARWPQADQSWSIDQDLEKVLEEVDQSHGPLDIVGHSYGGVLGMRVALARPDRTRKIWVHEPVLWGCYRALATPREVQDFDALVAPFIPYERSGTRDWMLEFVNFWSGPGTFQALPQPAQDDLVAQSHKLFAQVVGLLADDTGPPDLGAPAALHRLDRPHRAPATASLHEPASLRSTPGHPGGATRRTHGSSHPSTGLCPSSKDRLGRLTSALKAPAPASRDRREPTDLTPLGLHPTTAAVGHSETAGPGPNSGCRSQCWTRSSTGPDCQPLTTDLRPTISVPLGIKDRDVRRQLLPQSRLLSMFRTPRLTSKPGAKLHAPLIGRLLATPITPAPLMGSLRGRITPRRRRSPGFPTKLSSAFTPKRSLTAPEVPVVSTPTWAL